MPTFDEVYKGGLDTLFSSYAEQYKKDPVAAVNTFRNLTAQKKIMIDFYNKYLLRGEITRIEDLPRDEKQQLVKELGREAPLDFFRAIYALKHRNKQKP